MDSSTKVNNFTVDLMRKPIQREAAKLSVLEQWLPESSDKKVDGKSTTKGLELVFIGNGKKAMLCSAAVGKISSAAYGIAVNASQCAVVYSTGKGILLPDAKRHICSILARCGQLLEWAADFKDLDEEARVEALKLIEETNWFLYNVSKVNKCSPETWVSLARDRGAVVIADPISTAMEKTVSLFHKRFVEITAHLGGTYSKMLFSVARELLGLEEGGNPSDWSDWSDIRGCIISTYKEEGIPGRSNYRALAIAIEGYGKSCKALSKSGRGDQVGTLKESFTAGVVKMFEQMSSKEVRQMATYSILGVLCPWLGAEKGEEEVSFGFGLFRRNLTELGIAVEVMRGVDVDHSIEMSEKTTEFDLKTSRGKILEISVSGSFRPKGENYLIDASKSIFKTVDPVGYFLSNAISNRKEVNKATGEIKWIPLSNLRLNGETSLSEFWVDTFSYMLGGELPDRPEKVEVIRPCTSLKGDGVTTVKVPYLEDEGRLDSTLEDDKVSFDWDGDAVEIQWRAPRVKTVKRTKAIMLSARYSFNVGELDLVEADLPYTGAGDSFEAYFCVHPKDVAKDGEIPLQGTYVGARGWFLQGLLKGVLRITKSCPRGKMVVSRGSFKGEELKVLSTSAKILCMYRHVGDHARTNRSMFHRQDLVLASIGRFDSFLKDDDRISKGILSSIERTMGDIPCPIAMSKVTAATVGNADNVVHGRLPMDAFAMKLYGRPAIKELDEAVKDDYIVCAKHPMWEFYVSPTTFIKIAAVTGGPDLDDSFYVLFYANGKVEVMRDPQVAGDGYVLSSGEIL